MTRWALAPILFAVACSSPEADTLREPPRLTALRARQSAPGYDFVDRGGALTARIGGGSARIEGDRVAVAPAGGGFRFDLRTVHVGRREGARSLPAPARSRAEGQEAVLDRGDVEERYLAGPLGLEQTFRVAARPGGSGPLVIEVAFGGLAPSLEAGAVRLRDHAGATRAWYRDLSATDAAGRDLDARAEVASGLVRLIVDDTGALYPIVVDPMVLFEEATIAASDASNGDYFGIYTSASGDTAVVSSGKKTYVLARGADGVWAEQTQILVGWASVSGDTVIGKGAAPNAGAWAEVFVRQGALFKQQATLVPSGPEAVTVGFAMVSALEGDTAVIGALNAAFVFVRSGVFWTQQGTLTGDELNVQFAESIALSGDTVILGEGIPPSFAYVFVRQGTTWIRQAKLAPSDGIPGVGMQVALDGDTALVGAVGAAYVFVRSGTTWTEQAKLTVADPSTSPYQTAVLVRGDVAVVSTPGVTRVFVRSGGAWTEQASSTISVTDDTDYERPLAAAGNTLFLGKPGGQDVPGAVHVLAFGKAVGDACTLGFECVTGFCAGGVCCDAACAGACQACTVAAGAPADGTCAPLSGVTCGDGCTEGGTCQAGSCAGAAPKPDGTPCDDGDLCTTADACHAGVCGGATLACAAPDDCHDPGACDPKSGACSTAPAKPDGAPCAEGVCTAGLCAPPSTGGAGGSASGGAGGSAGGGAGGSASGGAGGSASGGAGGSTSGGTVFGGCGCRAARGGDGAGLLFAAALLFSIGARRRSARR